MSRLSTEGTKGGTGRSRCHQVGMRDGVVYKLAVERVMKDCSWLSLEFEPMLRTGLVLADTYTAIENRLVIVLIDMFRLIE